MCIVFCCVYVTLYTHTHDAFPHLGRQNSIYPERREAPVGGVRWLMACRRRRALPKVKEGGGGGGCCSRFCGHLIGCALPYTVQRKCTPWGSHVVWRRSRVHLLRIYTCSRHSRLCEARARARN